MVYGVGLLFFVKILSGMDGDKVLTPEDIQFGSTLLQIYLEPRPGILQAGDRYKEAEQKNAILISSPLNKNILKKCTSSFVASIKKDQIALNQALMHCCEKNYKYAAILFIKEGACLRVLNEKNQNILHLTAIHGSHNFYETLLNIITAIMNSPLNDLLGGIDIYGKTPQYYLDLAF